MPKLILLDGHSLAYRAYHALPPTMKTKTGELTNAVYGFVTTIFKILRDEQPDYLAVAFDVGRTFRDDWFADYKGTRQAMPDDLSYQIERIRAVIRAFNIPVLELDGYEADDVLGTVSRQAEQQKVETRIYTGDTDAFQLVSPLVRVVVSRKQFGDLAVYDEAAVKERYGLAPNQLADFRGLKGDTADNIPGVPGIGEKTATDLLQQFGTLEGIYVHLDEVTAKRAREALAANKDKAFLSKKLAIIVRDAPITLDLDACRVNAYDPEAVKAIFRELEFRSLMERLPASNQKSVVSGQIDAQQLAPPTSNFQPPTATHQLPITNYQIIQDEATLKKLAKQWKKAKTIAIDTETSSENALNAELVGISLAVKEGEAFYLPIGHRASGQLGLLGEMADTSDDYRCLSLDAVRAQLAPILADPKIAKVGHNIKFDVLVLAAHGMPAENIAFDTMLAAFLLEPHSHQLGLKDLGFKRLNIEMATYESLVGKGKDKLTMVQVPISQAGPYACADADVTYRLVGGLRDDLQAKQAWSLFNDIEMPLVPVLIAMEQAGVLLDTKFLATMKDELDKRLVELQREMTRIVKHEFNPNSTQQLSKVLFEELKLDTKEVPRTKAGGYSTSVEVLEQLQGSHPLIDLILEHRQLDKLQSTYVEALPALVSPKDGRLHTSYNQAGAVTGRISSSEPNLQNIPIRTELGRRVRRAFIAPEGHKLVKADYSQVELRILAHLSRDEGLLEAFARDEDVHVATAATIFGVPQREVTSTMRAIAKTTNYAIVYGISGFGLAARTELSPKEAQQFITSYFEKYPGVKKYLDETKEKARTLGYVETLLGRRRYFPELQSRAGNFAQRAAAERMAINAPVQGTSADIMKLAMIRLAAELQRKKMDSKMILQVHDELVFEAPDDEVKALAKLAHEVMANAYQLAVPLGVEVKGGKNWNEVGDIEG
jgi:DNA polymerase-1